MSAPTPTLVEALEPGDEVQIYQVGPCVIVSADPTSFLGTLAQPAKRLVLRPKGAGSSVRMTLRLDATLPRYAN